jgi:hypothetical protein
LHWPLQHTKKRRWKAAYATATGEVEALHKQLLAKQKELEGLEGRLKRLEAELRLLAAGTGAGGVRLPAAALAGKGGVTCMAGVPDTDCCATSALKGGPDSFTTTAVMPR